MKLTKKSSYIYKKLDLEEIWCLNLAEKSRLLKFIKNLINLLKI